MNILLLGSGGREHALAASITLSPHCTQLFVAPGNAGTATLATNLAINLLDFEKIAEACLKNQIKMVVAGSELPLVKGIKDYFLAKPELAHILIVGAGSRGAALEGSKHFAKIFMQKYAIPTAAYQSFTLETLQNGIDYLSTQPLPIVLKADGLAEGKGVIIAQTLAEAEKSLVEMLQNEQFGVASQKVVIEQFLDGIELSVFVLTNGVEYKILPTAKDYKRIGVGDTGLNTGGMGAISPVPFADEIFMQKVETQIIKPTMLGLQTEGIPYYGFIFFGLISVQGEPYVIEYNVRMGDPETQAILPRIQSDFVALLLANFNHQLHDFELLIDERTAATVVLVSGGYPEDYQKNKLISGTELVADSLVFEAGTTKLGDQTFTNGGRVLAITSFGKNKNEALALCYKNAETIHFEAKYFRPDIGFDL